MTDASDFVTKILEQKWMKASAVLTVSMETAGVLPSDVHWLDAWADMKWREGLLTVAFRGTTFTVNKRWVRGDYSSREGQKTVFVWVWSLKMDPKDEYLCQGTSLWGGGMDGCLHPCSQKSHLLVIGLYFTSDWWIKKMWEHDVGDSFEHLSSCFFFWMIHPCERRAERCMTFMGEWFRQRVRVTSVWWVRQTCLYPQLKLSHSKIQESPGGDEDLEGFRREDFRLLKRLKRWALLASGLTGTLALGLTAGTKTSFICSIICTGLESGTSQTGTGL